MNRWLGRYERQHLRHDLVAGLTVGAMLVPQAMAYALLAGLPPEVGLYAATIPVLVYALIGTSRQLAVGPVAIVSLLTASALAPLVDEGTAGYVAAAALLALMVGAAHLLLGVARLGFLTNYLSHPVLVGFTAAAALLIGFSQVKHLLGISVDRHDRFYETLWEIGGSVADSHLATVLLGAAAIATLLALKRLAPRVPAALVVVAASVVAVTVFDLDAHGVATVGDIPDSFPPLGLPEIDASLVGELVPTAFVITLVGFMESIAVAKVYARRNRYEVDPNRELVALGLSNGTAGLAGGYPVTGGFSRTAVNASAGARTRLASMVTAGVVLLTLLVLTPLFTNLPKAALGAIIVVAVAGLIDWQEMRHVARVKRSDLLTMAVAFVATLTLGIEIGIGVAVVASMLVVFARMSRPHTATLGRLPGTTTYRNVDRYPEAETTPGVTVIRIDAAVSFANAANVKRLLLSEAAPPGGEPPRTLVVDASGINDIDATGADMLDEVLDELEDRGVALHLCSVKGPVRDVLRRSGLWTRLGPAVHATTDEALTPA